MNTQYLETMPEDWQSIACIYSALGDETRQKILLLFEPGEVIGRKSLTDLLPLSQTAVAHHVTTLVRAGLLVPKKSGREVYYTLNLELLINSLDRVHDYATAMLAAREAKKS